jgi:hypothetical protein
MTAQVLTHTPVGGEEFMPDGWCGACESCSPAPTVCLACSYISGGPSAPVLWPCAHVDVETIDVATCHGEL